MTLALVPYCHRAPALSIHRVIRELGWRIRTGYVLPGHLGQVDVWHKEVTLPSDFRARLACPELARKVEHWVLAHELAHIALHQAEILRGERTQKMERAAATWALEWLLPRAALLDHPEARRLPGAGEKERWARMARIAEEFLVPTTAVELALAHHQGKRPLLVSVAEILAA